MSRPVYGYSLAQLGPSGAEEFGLDKRDYPTEAAATAELNSWARTALLDLAEFDDWLDTLCVVGSDRRFGDTGPLLTLREACRAEARRAA